MSKPDYVAHAAFWAARAAATTDWRELVIPVYCRRIIGKLYWRKRITSLVKKAGDVVVCAPIWPKVFRHRLYWKTGIPISEEYARQMSDAAIAELNRLAMENLDASGYTRQAWYEWTMEGAIAHMTDLYTKQITPPNENGGWTLAVYKPEDEK